jgi:hypothetical protein
MIEVKPWMKKPVKLPGIYSGMPIKVYHSAEAAIEPSISSTGLRTIRTKSPKHYWLGSPYNPKAVEYDATAALKLGQAAHHLLFRQEAFKAAFAVQPETLGGEPFSLRTKVGKYWKEEREKEGRTVLTATQFEHIQGIAESLAADPAVKAGCLNGRIEESYFWKDRATGIWLKARPDVNPTDDLAFVDLKLTRSTEWGYIQRALHEYGYYQQAGLVASACEAIYGRAMDSFSFLFVENEPPYDIEFVMLKEPDLVRGQKANRAALDTFAACLKANHWPGRRGDRVEPKWIEMRKYDQEQIDAEAAS